MPIVYEHSTMSLLDVFLGIVFLSLKLDTTFFFLSLIKSLRKDSESFFVFFLNIKPWLMIPKTQFLNLVEN